VYEAVKGLHDAIYQIYLAQFIWFINVIQIAIKAIMCPILDGDGIGNAAHG
jgi:hypothetical protein